MGAGQLGLCTGEGRGAGGSRRRRTRTTDGVGLATGGDVTTRGVAATMGQRYGTRLVSPLAAAAWKQQLPHV